MGSLNSPFLTQSRRIKWTLPLWWWWWWWSREAPLPHRRVRPPVRGGAGVLGAGHQPGGALLLDDLHPAQGHPGDARRPGQARPGQRQAQRGGDRQEVWVWRRLSRGSSDSVAEIKTQNMVDIWRALLQPPRQGLVCNNSISGERVSPSQQPQPTVVASKYWILNFPCWIPTVIRSVLADEQRKLWKGKLKLYYSKQNSHSYIGIILLK